ncbi:hypothetical protein ACOMHN_062677, partial [Nucella lapillus]
ASRGREFYLVFMETKWNSSDASLQPSVSIVNPNGAAVQLNATFVDLDGRRERKTRTLAGSGFNKYTWSIFRRAILSGATKHRKCLHFISTGDIFLHCNVLYQSKDEVSLTGFMVLPTSALSTDYVAATYCATGTCVLVVTSVVSANTVRLDLRVQFNPGRQGPGAEYNGQYYSDDDIIVESLDAGESMQVTCVECDLTGSWVKATKKVAVFCGGLMTKDNRRNSFLPSCSLRTAIATVSSRRLTGSEADKLGRPPGGLPKLGLLPAGLSSLWDEADKLGRPPGGLSKLGLLPAGLSSLWDGQHHFPALGQDNVLPLTAYNKDTPYKDAVSAQLLGGGALGREYVVGAGYPGLRGAVRVVVLQAGQHVTLNTTTHTATRPRAVFSLPHQDLQGVTTIGGTGPLMVMEVVYGERGSNPDISMHLPLPRGRWTTGYMAYLAGSGVHAICVLQPNNHSNAAPVNVLPSNAVIQNSDTVTSGGYRLMRVMVRGRGTAEVVCARDRCAPFWAFVLQVELYSASSYTLPALHALSGQQVRGVGRGHTSNLTSDDSSPRNHTSYDTSPSNRTSDDSSPRNHTSYDTSHSYHTSDVTSPSNHTNDVTSPSNHISDVTSPSNHTSDDSSHRNHTSEVTSHSYYTSDVTSPSNHTNDVTSPSNHISDVTSPSNHTSDDSNPSNQTSDDRKGNHIPIAT